MEFGFEPVCDQLGTSFEPASVMEFGFKGLRFEPACLCCLLRVCVAAVKLRLLRVVWSSGKQPSRLLRPIKTRLHFRFSTAPRRCKSVLIFLVYYRPSAENATFDTDSQLAIGKVIVPDSCYNAT